jgi:hypothetical protein
MEEYIIYIVIAISVVANIYKNFKKQQEADAKRATGMPVPRPRPAQASPVPPLNQQPKPNPAPKPAQTTRSGRSKSLIESDIEQLKKDGRLAPSVEYTSLESTIGNYSSLSDTSLFVPMDEGFESVSSITDDDIKDGQPLDAKPHPLFADKDDFRKAIIYSTILERKYA